jgi:hypothetical protein
MVDTGCQFVILTMTNRSNTYDRVRGAQSRRLPGVCRAFHDVDKYAKRRISLLVLCHEKRQSCVLFFGLFLTRLEPIRTD